MRLNYHVNLEDDTRAQMHFTNNEVLLMVQIIRLRKSVIRSTPLLTKQICQALFNANRGKWSSDAGDVYTAQERKQYFMQSFANNLASGVVDSVIEKYKKLYYSDFED